MKRNIIVAAMLIMVLAVFLSGCTSAGSQDSRIPYGKDEWAENKSDSQREMNEVVFYTEDNEFIGTYYLQKALNSKDKISDNVIKDQFKYLYDIKTAIYIDSDYNLYSKKDGEEKIKIASDVTLNSLLLSGDNSTLAFTSEYNELDPGSGELYIAKMDKEREKISSNVSVGNYKLSYDGNTVYYNSSSDLYVKKDQKEKEKIASEVSLFEASKSGNSVIYQKFNDGLYYKSDTESESQKIYSGRIGDIQASFFGDSFCFLDDYIGYADTPKGELYIFKPGMEPMRVSSDIKKYTLTADGRKLYYLNIDNNLYELDIPELKRTDEKSIQKFKEAINKSERVKLGTEVINYDLSTEESIISWANNDFELYILEKGKDKMKIASDVESSKVSKNALVYLNKDKDLYVISRINNEEFDVDKKVKIGTDILGYAASPYAKYITCANSSGELYYINVGAEPVKLSEKLDEFSQTLFLNKIVHEKRLQIKDIAGTWMSVNSEYGDSLIQIDDKLNYYSTNTSYTTEFSSIEADKSTLRFGGDTTIELLNKDYLIYTIIIEEPEIEEFVRISKEEFDLELKNMNKKTALRNRGIGYLYMDIVLSYGTNAYRSAAGEWIGIIPYGISAKIDDFFIEENKSDLWLRCSWYDSGRKYYAWFREEEIM